MTDPAYPGNGGATPPPSYRPDTGMRWLSGNIRRKLTLFVVVIMMMMLSMFWVFTVYLLRPAYENSIRNELATALGTVAGIIDEAYNAGEAVVLVEKLNNNLARVSLAPACIERIDAAIQGGSLNMDGRCLDIADANQNNLLLACNLEPRCLLHPAYETGINEEGLVTTVLERNGEAATIVRREVFENNGGVYSRTESGVIMMGTTVAGGSVSVVVSTNVERITYAVGVLQKLMLPLSLLLAVFSTTTAFIFSRWFTRPLSKLSAAAREMGRGNYDVRVEETGDDEIGELGRDFNLMAQEVARSAQLQRDLLANVSHDLRTPLTLIKGYAETVRDLTGDQPEKRTEQLNVIVDESDRLTSLVNSVMELSRMSSGAEKPEPVRFDLFDLCDELAYRYEELARQHGNKFFFSGEEGCDIYADPGLTERALHNLLGNAISHVGEDGFIGLKVYVTERNTVRCEVSDHGLGIADADLPHIFDRYYRSRADSGKPGTGLGLSITKAIFQTQEMKYGVMTELGKGSTFWFESPRV